MRQYDKFLIFFPCPCLNAFVNALRFVWETNHALRPSFVLNLDNLLMIYFSISDVLRMALKCPWIAYQVLSQQFWPNLYQFVPYWQTNWFKKYSGFFLFLIKKSGNKSNCRSVINFIYSCLKGQLSTRIPANLFLYTLTEGSRERCRLSLKK